jgi:hypothetical protein
MNLEITKCDFKIRDENLKIANCDLKAK